MATAYTVNITPDNTGLWSVTQTESAARQATELLNKDIEKHNVFFNDRGFHNHISHQILALFGTGASAETILKGWKENDGYQRPAKKPNQNVVDELRDWKKAQERLGKEEYYAEWLVFFQHETERLGWQGVLSEYLFKGDDRSEDLFPRMLAGAVHPIIQLMYGVEWAQPAIVAMALAQASVHKQDYLPFYLEAERLAAAAGAHAMPTLLSLLEAARADPALQAARLPGDGAGNGQHVVDAAGPALAALAARVRVAPDDGADLAERTAEMFHTAVLTAAAAAAAAGPPGQPDRDPKFEFFLMHHVNVVPALVTLNAQAWVPAPAKVRLLEWKMRLDLLNYVARGAPALDVGRVTGYVPKAETPGPFADVLPRILNFVDDGHAVKLFRAVGIGRHVCQPYEERGCDWLLIKGDTWDKIGHMVADSVEAPGPTWVRNSGFDEAWEDVQPRQRGAVNGRL